MIVVDHLLPTQLQWSTKILHWFSQSVSLNNEDFIFCKETSWDSMKWSVCKSRCCNSIANRYMLLLLAMNINQRHNYFRCWQSSFCQLYCLKFSFILVNFSIFLVMKENKKIFYTVYLWCSCDLLRKDWQKFVRDNPEQAEWVLCRCWGSQCTNLLRELLCMSYCLHYLSLYGYTLWKGTFSWQCLSLLSSFTSVIY